MNERSVQIKALRRLARLEILSERKPFGNRPLSIYQYSNMDPRLLGKNCEFLKFPLSFNSRKRLGYKENNARKPRSHVRILILYFDNFTANKSWYIERAVRAGDWVSHPPFIGSCAVGKCFSLGARHRAFVWCAKRWSYLALSVVTVQFGILIPGSIS